MSWSTLRFSVAVFWLAMAATVLRSDVPPPVITAALVLAGLSVFRRSEEMPERRFEGVVMWVALAAAILVSSIRALSGWPLAVLVPILWTALATLFWRRFYPQRQRKNA